MAVPLIFKPVEIDGEYYYDGALSNNFPIKIFSHISKDNIIAMVIYSDKEEYKPSKTKINIFYIFRQIWKMFEILRINQVTMKEIKMEDKDYYYIPKNNTMQQSINFIVNRKGVKIELLTEQIDEMILYGFTSMIEFIENRKKLLGDKNKERLKDYTELSI
jgi:predicted acylesterase/phospholipase RssA